MHNGRAVFSLLYRLECPPPEIRELIVPLDRDGNAIGPIWSVKHGKRIVNETMCQRLRPPAGQ